MKLRLKTLQLKRLTQQRNGYAGLALCLGLVAMGQLMLLGVMWRYQRVILVPPTLTQSVWLSRANISLSYLRQMSLYLALLRLNVTPGNHKAQQAAFLQWVAPSAFGTLKAQFAEEAKRYQSQQLSTDFVANEVDINPKTKQVILTGQLRLYVGEALTRQQPVRYRLQFHYQGGRLWLTQFDKVTTHETH